MAARLQVSRITLLFLGLEPHLQASFDPLHRSRYGGFVEISPAHHVAQHDTFTAKLFVDIFKVNLNDESVLLEATAAAPGDQTTSS
jgi:hypothetical protein